MVLVKLNFNMEDLLMIEGTDVYRDVSGVIRYNVDKVIFDGVLKQVRLVFDGVSDDIWRKSFETSAL